eukprot:TRINITY_DN7061_c0_g1_i1.p1 TRINITY_DN7061_c0_g1~~TRINITY_DN7061_c0_g1_i1.p1  ORF type:complete len:308 (-),score=70.36 TRINITY_DN7061_c0_g1_i1:37-873(-)
MSMVKLGISNELNAPGATPQTMFRSNSGLSRMMSTYTKLIGRHFLVHVLKPLIQSVLSDPTGYEIDPSKLAEGETPDANLEKLIHMSQYFLDSIIRSASSLPIPFREMSYYLQQEVIRAFDAQSRHAAVGSFIFLRFICPAILAPESAQLIDTKLEKEARRPLILIGKILQNLSNGVKFGTKETFMQGMNVFIDRNLIPIQNFFDSIAIIEPNEIAKYQPLATREECHSIDVPKVHAVMVKNLSTLTKTLSKANNNQSGAIKLVGLLGRLSAVFEKSS